MNNPRAHNAANRLARRMHYNAREDAGMNGKRSRRVFRPRPMTTNEQYSMLMDIAYRIGDRVMLASTLRRLKEVLQ